MPKKFHLQQDEDEEVQISVSGIPKDLLERMRRLAKAERRSLSSYVVSRLEQAASEAKEGHQQAA